MKLRRNEKKKKINKYALSFSNVPPKNRRYTPPTAVLSRLHLAVLQYVHAIVFVIAGPSSQRMPYSQERKRNSLCIIQPAPDSRTPMNN